MSTTNVFMRDNLKRKQGTAIVSARDTPPSPDNLVYTVAEGIVTNTS